MKRIPEPELMDDLAQARAYAQADFSQSNELFISLLKQQAPFQIHGKALDLGCGPADIPLRLLRRYPRLSVDAVDGSEPMLNLAREEAVKQAVERDRLSFIFESLPSVLLREAYYKLILSNSLLHHLDDPNDLWLTIKHTAEIGAQIIIMDLFRPSSEMAVVSLLETHGMNESELLRRDFKASLHAAYTLEEVRGQLKQNGLEYLKISMVSDRHWCVQGCLQ